MGEKVFENSDGRGKNGLVLIFVSVVLLLKATICVTLCQILFWENVF